MGGVVSAASLLKISPRSAPSGLSPACFPTADCPKPSTMWGHGTPIYLRVSELLTGWAMNMHHSPTEAPFYSQPQADRFSTIMMPTCSRTLLKHGRLPVHVTPTVLETFRSSKHLSRVWRQRWRGWWTMRSSGALVRSWQCHQTPRGLHALCSLRCWLLLKRSRWVDSCSDRASTITSTESLCWLVMLTTWQ